MNALPAPVTPDVKICGLTRAADMAHCAQLGVRWAGLVFYPPSPRFVSPAQARILHQAAPEVHAGGPLRVGLFVKPQADEIEKALQEVPLDILQLYTTPDEARRLGDLFGLPVWLACGVSRSSDLPRDTSGMNGFVIEAPAAPTDTRPGGLGKNFDWTLTQNWTAPLPWLLAGGLTHDNVQDALTTSGAPAVDVSSGVESAPGIKSFELMEKFVRNVRSRGCDSGRA